MHVSIALISDAFEKKTHASWTQAFIIAQECSVLAIISTMFLLHSTTALRIKIK